MNDSEDRSVDMQTGAYNGGVWMMVGELRANDYI